MRSALIVVGLVVVAWPALASAEPCATGADCAAACAKDTAACARGAELYFEGTDGHVLDHGKSFRLAKRGCDRGDGFACSLLGFHYQDGLGTAQAPAKAVRAYEKGCRAKTGVACFNLASMYYGGHGVAVDHAKGDALTAKARTHWEAACKGDAPRWCTNLAFLDARDRARASNREALNQRACDSGFRTGCHEVIRTRFDTKAITAAQFVTEMTKLCDGGLAMACGSAGMYLVDEGGDPKRGIVMVRRACDSGDKLSCLFAGDAFARGTHGPTDLARAVRAFERACDRAMAAACQILAELYQNQRELSKAAAFARRSCHMGQYKGCDMISIMLLFGAGVPKNERAGLAYARDACRMGSGGGCGELVRRDVELPVPRETKKRLYKQACDGGHEPACKRLAKLR